MESTISDESPGANLEDLGILLSRYQTKVGIENEFRAIQLLIEERNLNTTALGVKLAIPNVNALVSTLQNKGWINTVGPLLSVTETGSSQYRQWKLKNPETDGKLSTMDMQDLFQSLSFAQLILSNAVSETRGQQGFTIRPFETGDVAHIASRQAKLYKNMFNWGLPLENVILETATEFLRKFKPETEQCFVAEVNGAFAGGVIITDEGQGLARLRLLHVEPSARRRGIGDALVRNCVEFARETNFSRIILWTHTVLAAARHIYAKNGFEVYETNEHTHFGPPVQGEMWCLKLS